MKQSPIFVKTYVLMEWLIPCTLSFPRSQRGVLARQVQAQIVALQEALVDAGLAGDGRPHLHCADGHLTKLRIYVRLCRDLKLLSTKQYGHASRLMAEVGRLLGGWLKAWDTDRVGEVDPRQDEAVRAPRGARLRGRAGHAAGRVVEQ